MINAGARRHVLRQTSFAAALSYRLMVRKPAIHLLIKSEDYFSFFSDAQIEIQEQAADSKVQISK